MNFKLLIDGDLFAYRNAASAENDDVEVAYMRVNSLLHAICTEFNTVDYVIYLSGKNNFRFNVYPEYKANRIGVPKPRHLEAVREYLISEYHAEVSEGCEADDLMAINQTEQTIIVSLDKDMLQVPGSHYSWYIEGGPPDKRWVKDAVFQTVGEVQGLRHFYTQMLTGDTSDNIKGAKGVGKVKAAAMLAAEDLTEDDMFEIVRTQYGNDMEMMMNAECLWILRKPSETFSKTKKGQELEASIMQGEGQAPSANGT